ncbi:hypothetical protein EN844_34230, partial [Mesorhizobium sp. M3A.F.Ca.ET.201.01.1.1]
RNVQPSTPIHCAECGAYLGTWDEIQTDFEQQGGSDGVFRLASGRIRRLAYSGSPVNACLSKSELRARGTSSRCRSYGLAPSLAPPLYPLPWPASR